MIQKQDYQHIPQPQKRQLSCRTDHSTLVEKYIFGEQAQNPQQMLGHVEHGAASAFKKQRYIKG